MKTKTKNRNRNTRKTQPTVELPEIRQVLDFSRHQFAEVMRRPEAVARLLVKLPDDKCVYLTPCRDKSVEIKIMRGNLPLMNFRLSHAGATALYYGFMQIQQNPAIASKMDAAQRPQVPPGRNYQADLVKAVERDMELD